MSGIRWDDVVEPAARTTGAPTLQPQPWDDAVDEVAAARARRDEVARRFAATREPDRHARVLTLAQDLGAPVDSVDRQFDTAEQTLRERIFDLHALRAGAPATADWLSNPDHAAIARDDVANLGTLEYLIGRWRRRNFGEWAVGAARSGPVFGYGGLSPIEQTRPGAPQVALRQSEAQLELMHRLAGHLERRTDPDDDPRIRELDAFVRRDLGQKERGLATRMVVGSSGIVGPLLEGLDAAAKGGATAGATAAAVSAFFPPAEAVSVPAATTVGAVSSGAFATFKMERASAYGELVRAMKERGVPVDREKAARAANLVGIVNGLLEIAPVITWAKYLPGIKGWLTQRAGKAVLARPTVMTALFGGGKAAAEQIGVESVTEGLQRASTSAGREGAVAAAGGEADFSGIPAEALEETLAAAESFALLAIPGTGATLFEGMTRAREAKLQQTRFEQLGKLAEASKLLKRMPGKFQELVGKVVGTAGGPDTVFIPVEAWNTYFQSQSVDPQKVASDVLGQPGLAAYAEAQATNGDLAIPFDTYVARIAPTPHHLQLVPDLRFDPAEMTGRQAEAFEASIEERVAAVAEKAQATAAESDAASGADAHVLETVTQALREVGFDEKTAGRYGELYRGFFATMAQRTGKDAAALFQEYALRVRREETQKPLVRPTREAAAPAPKGKATFAAEDIRSAADVATWIRDAGGIRAAQSSELKKGRKAARQIPLNLRNDKTGTPIEKFGEQLVEAGYFEDDRAAVDWIYEALVNPTGLELPARATTISDKAIARQAEEHLAGQGAQRAAALAPRAAGLGIPEDRALALLERALVAGEGVETVSAFELQEGEVVAYAGDVYRVTYPEEGEAPALVGEKTIRLGDDADVEVLRLGRVSGDRAQGPVRLFQSSASDEIDAGRVAMAQVLEDHTDQTEAMHRPGLGAIAFLWGEPGRPAKSGKLKGGWGVSHIVAQREAEGADGRAIAMRMPDVIARGLVVRIQNEGQPGERIHIRLGKHTAILSTERLGEKQVWLLTGWEEGGAGGVNPPRAYAPERPGMSPSAGASPRIMALNAHLVKPERFDQGEDENRGFIRFTPGGREFEIGLLEKADLSTFLHESGHFFLEVYSDLAEALDAPEVIQNDYRALLDWLGVKGRAGIRREHHEQFARGFEAWLMEGKAPTPALQPIFSRFRAWLLAIYKRLEALNVQLTDEVRGVFSRMVATEEQIAWAEELQAYGPMFPDAKAAGMTAAEFAAYQRTVERARDEGRTRLLKQLIEEQRREQEAWWREEKAATRAEVRRELGERREYRAIHAFRTGTMLDGSEVPDALKGADGRVYKLDRDSLRAMLGPAFEAQLNRRLAFTWVREGGVHPDVVAGVFGFGSGHEMVQAMAGTTNLDAAITEETDRRMKEKHGDVWQGGQIGDAAMDAVHEPENRIRQFMAELRALNRRAGRPEDPVPAQALKEAARRTIAGKKARTIRADLYMYAEGKAGRAAFEAAAKGDFEKALVEKQRQILNHFLYHEARTAKEEIDATISYLRKMGKGAARARLGKAGAHYLDASDAILERFDLKPISNRDAATRESLAAMIEQERNEGNLPIPKWVLDETRKDSWKNLTYEELIGLRDSVKMLEHQARETSTAKARDRRITMEAAREELITDLRNNVPDRGPLPTGRRPRGKLQEIKERWEAQHHGKLKVEELLRRAAGQDENFRTNTESLWFQLVKDPIDAAFVKREDLSQAVMAKLIEAFGRLAQEHRDTLYEERYIKSLGDKLDFAEMLAVALNYGNESNYRKLLEGGRQLVASPDAKAVGWDENVLEEILGHLTEKHWDAVQGIWDALESLWPAIEAVEREDKGVPPPRVQPRSFVRTFADGTRKEYRGGYYPVKYDPRFSRAGERQVSEAQSTWAIYKASMGDAATAHGHTIERVENFSRPIDLDLDNLTSHVQKVIHDAAFRLAIKRVDKILRDEEIRTAMRRYFGEAAIEQFDSWLRDVALEGIPANDGGSRAMNAAIRKARHNASVVFFGFRWSTGAQNVINLANAANRVNPARLAWAVTKFMRHPVLNVQFVQAHSGEMRHRIKNLDRDLAEQLHELRKSKLGRADQNARRFAFYFMAATDQMVAYPTWLAAYEEHRAANPDAGDDAHLHYADHVVRTALGSGAIKDLAAELRGGEKQKLLTAFYGWFSTAVYNEGSGLLWDVKVAKREKRLARKSLVLLARYWYLMVFPPILSALATRDTPDDDESALAWAARQWLSYPFMGFVFLRHVARGIASGWDPKFTPALEVLNRATDTGREVVDVAGAAIGADWDAAAEEAGDLLKPGAKLAQYAFGVPQGPLNSLEYLWDVATGEAAPESATDLASGALYGPVREGGGRR